MKQNIWVISFFILIAFGGCRDRGDSALLIVTDRDNALSARIAAVRSLTENDKGVARRKLGEQLTEKWDSGTLDALTILAEIGDESTVTLLRSQKMRDRMGKDEGQVNAAIIETIAAIESRLPKKPKSGLTDQP